MTGMKLQMGLKVIVPDDEPIEDTLRRFKKAVAQKGVIIPRCYYYHRDTYFVQPFF